LARLVEREAAPVLEVLIHDAIIVWT
jgi:hypothetical protein